MTGLGGGPPGTKVLRTVAVGAMASGAEVFPTRMVLSPPSLPETNARYAAGQSKERVVTTRLLPEQQSSIGSKH